MFNDCLKFAALPLLCAALIGCDIPRENIPAAPGTVLHFLQSKNFDFAAAREKSIEVCDPNKPERFEGYDRRAGIRDGEFDSEAIMADGAVVYHVTYSIDLSEDEVLGARDFAGGPCMIVTIVRANQPQIWMAIGPQYPPHLDGEEVLRISKNARLRYAQECAKPGNAAHPDHQDCKDSVVAGEVSSVQDDIIGSYYIGTDGVWRTYWYSASLGFLYNGLFPTK